ncbi:uncharacterized protein LOC116181040 [Photinus pyralis]|uniref:uncharacterized protein LOC116181040 n=1 Tax=Photinus pyralis TaxID=7054 RepID=UPI001266E6C7|nr:uncharacterized protein LOC116181040 [Photinus pyralis]
MTVCASCAKAFFWSSGAPTTQQRTVQAYPLPAYYPRYMQMSPPVDDRQPVPLPAIPIQMPLHASLSPTPNVQNVQLVPCICPISSDVEYDKSIENAAAYVNQKNQQT